MDFSLIALSRRELRLLKISKKHPIEKNKAKRLLRFKLVEEHRIQKTPGGMPSGTGLCIISNYGIDYLAYRKEQARFFTLEYFFTHILIPVAVGIISAVLTAIILSA